jgi:short subunit dehydrogenase-like uncharacterized protein
MAAAAPAIATGCVQTHRTGAVPGLRWARPDYRMNAMRASRSRPFDVVLYGATGFVGRQTAAYFAQHAGGLRWAVAGRSAPRLEQLAAALGLGDIGIIEADGADDASLGALARDARVVLSSAGPFALHGSALVAACVAQRTHYVDITGETPWVRDLIDRHHGQAARDGTRIVPCCGFDSVPSDLGAFLVADALRRHHGEACGDVKACFALKGGVNGGTLASMFHALESCDSRRIADPFLLNPEAPAGADPADHADPLGARRDTDFNAWVGPFFMGPINTRVVRRSAALMGGATDTPYAPDFHYQEYLRFGRGAFAAVGAAATSIGLAAGQELLRFDTMRRFAQGMAVAPGAGPTAAAMDGGSFRCELVGRGDAGSVVRGRIAGRGDPGNRATTVFVCEAALALALDEGALPGGAGHGGLLTPASAFGHVLAGRLAAAGMTVDIGT